MFNKEGNYHMASFDDTSPEKDFGEKEKEILLSCEHRKSYETKNAPKR